MRSDPSAPVKLRTDHISWRQVGDDIVVLDVRRSTYLTVAGSGALIWQLAVSGTTFGEIVEELQQVYDVGADVVTADVLGFLGDLERRGLLVAP